MLGLDTATPTVTVAVCDGEQVLAEFESENERRHGEVLAPAIDSVLQRCGVEPAGLGAVVAGVGPGPFTGLRVGLVTARTLGAVLGIPVIGVCTLDVIALGSGLAGDFRGVTDARRREVHLAAYRARPARPQRPDRPDVGGPPLRA